LTDLAVVPMMTEPPATSWEMPGRERRTFSTSPGWHGGSRRLGTGGHEAREVGLADQLAANIPEPSGSS
jgi:hypothetical protein